MTSFFNFWERVASTEKKITTSRWSLSTSITRNSLKAMRASEFNIRDLHYLLLSLILLNTCLTNTQSFC